MLTISPTLGRQSATNIYYPESDGNPIADNTLQFRWIVTIQGGIAAEHAHNPAVFVAGDLLWYPIEGDNKTRIAPDILVAFGRPKGERGSYLQWVEGGIAPQVVWEVLSPGNRAGEMRRKLDFYQRFGVEEYYVYDPDRLDITGWRRDSEGILRSIARLDEWISPRLGIQFVVRAGRPLELLHSDGRPFLTFQELSEERDEQMRARAVADEARYYAEQERTRAEQALVEERRMRERLAARLQEMGIDPETL